MIRVEAASSPATSGGGTRRELLLGALSLTSLAASVLAQTPASARIQSPNFIELDPRDNVAAVVLRGLDGKDIRLGRLRGRPLLVSFWASWCPPCRRELPILHTLQKSSAELPFVLLPISADRDAATAKAFIRRLGLDGFRSFIDPPAGRGAIGPTSPGTGHFPLYGMPITYVIDSQGRSAGYWTGEADLRAADTQTFIASLG